MEQRDIGADRRRLVTRFVEETEPRLKVAQYSAFGRQVALEATADALAYGLERWDRIAVSPNSAG